MLKGWASTRLLLAAAMVVGCAGAATAEPSEPEATVKFDFDKPSEAKQWVVGLGTWKIENGAYGTKFTAEGAAVTMYRGVAGDLKATAVIRQTADGYHGGALVRVSSNGTGVSGYYIGVMHKGTAGVVEVFRLKTFNPALQTGGAAKLCSTPVSIKKPTGYQTVGLSLAGPKFEVTLNGKVACRFSDGAYKQGAFGFLAFGTQGSQFQVNSLTATVP